jgi:hypothetical protein
MLTGRDLVLVFIVTLSAVSLALVVFFLTQVGPFVLALVVVLTTLGVVISYLARSARNPAGPPY